MAELNKKAQIGKKIEKNQRFNSSIFLSKSVNLRASPVKYGM